jgi:predicted phage gp36 major capsid-like protein
MERRERQRERERERERDRDRDRDRQTDRQTILRARLHQPAARTACGGGAAAVDTRCIRRPLPVLLGDSQCGIRWLRARRAAS